MVPSKFYQKTLKTILIIDHEYYIPADPEDVSVKQYIHASNRDDVSYCDRVRPKAKFKKKYLIWQAIYKFGNISVRDE